MRGAIIAVIARMQAYDPEFPVKVLLEQVSARETLTASE